MFTCKKGHNSRVIIEFWLQSKIKKLIKILQMGMFFSSYSYAIGTKFDMSLLSLTKSGPRPQVENYLPLHHGVLYLSFTWHKVPSMEHSIPTNYKRAIVQQDIQW